MSDPTGGADAAEHLFAAFAEQEALRGQALRQWAQSMEDAVGSDAFAAASSRLLALYLQQQQALRAAARAAAEALQTPTIEDLAAVSRLVVNVERKADEISEAVHRIEARLDAIEATRTSGPAAAKSRGVQGRARATGRRGPSPKG